MPHHDTRHLGLYVPDEYYILTEYWMSLKKLGDNAWSRLYAHVAKDRRMCFGIPIPDRTLRNRFLTKKKKAIYLSIYVYLL